MNAALEDAPPPPGGINEVTIYIFIYTERDCSLSSLKYTKTKQTTGLMRETHLEQQQ